MKRLRPKPWLLMSLMLLVWSIPVDRGAEAFLKRAGAEEPARVIVVFVDMSGSANLARRTAYGEGFEKVYERLAQGDRILVGTITGRSYIDFKPAIDVEIPRKSIWVNRIQFERNLTETKEKIRREVDKLLSERVGTARTEILNSLNIADTIFHEEKRRRVLVLFSDMIQDSQEYNFAKTDVTGNYIEKVIRYRQKQDLIPDLRDVKIYVAGASGLDPNKFRSVQTFWSRYFQEAGADFSPHRYGHSLISFEKQS